MYMKTSENQEAGGVSILPPVLSFSSTLVLAVMISAYGVLRMGIFPSIFLTFVQQSHLLLK